MAELNECPESTLSGDLGGLTMIKRIAALVFLCLTLGATITACDMAPDNDDAEVEVDDDD